MFSPIPDPFTSLVSSPATFLACSKAKHPHLKRFNFSVSPRRLKKVEKSTKQLPDAPPAEAQESSGNSSSKLPSELQPLLKELDVLPSSRQQGDNREAGHSPGAATFVGTPLGMEVNIVEGRMEEIGNATPAVSYGLTEIVHRWGGEGLSEDEMEASSGIIILGKYSVKEALELIIRRVTDKYGDIAANYVLESLTSRSFALENLADFLQKLEKAKFGQLKESEIEEKLNFVSDLGKGGLDVGWLEERMKDLVEAWKMVRQSSKLKEKKDKFNEVIKEKKRFPEIAEREVKAAKEQLSIALAEVEQIKATTFQVKCFLDALVHGLY